MKIKKISKHVTLTEKTLEILEKIKSETGMSYSDYINHVVQRENKNDQHSQR